jgi:DNA-binding NarL/FixJ family response regulator
MPVKRPTCRVALLYHDPLLRDIVHHVFGEAEDIEIVAELPATQLPVEQLIAAEPDVVVVDRRTMDDTLPTTLSTVLGALVVRRPGVRVIALSLAEARVTVFSGWQMSDLSIETLMACVRGTEPALRRARARQRPPVPGAARQRARRRAAGAS